MDNRRTKDEQKTNKRQTKDKQKTNKRQTKDKQKTNKRQTKVSEGIIYVQAQQSQQVPTQHRQE
jgi:hypothetical protein